MRPACITCVRSGCPAWPHHLISICLKYVRVPPRQAQLLRPPPGVLIVAPSSLLMCSLAGPSGAWLFVAPLRSLLWILKPKSGENGILQVSMHRNSKANARAQSGMPAGSVCDSYHVRRRLLPSYGGCPRKGSTAPCSHTLGQTPSVSLGARNSHWQRPKLAIQPNLQCGRLWQKRAFLRWRRLHSSKTG